MHLFPTLYWNGCTNCSVYYTHAAILLVLESFLPCPHICKPCQCDQNRLPSALKTKCILLSCLLSPCPISYWFTFRILFLSNHTITDLRLCNSSSISWNDRMCWIDLSHPKLDVMHNIFNFANVSPEIWVSKKIISGTISCQCLCANPNAKVWKMKY